MPRTHASLPRLHVEAPLQSGGELVLDKDQSLYLITVMRKGAGEEVILFNGREGAWRAAISEPSKKAARLDLVEQIALQTPRNDLWYGFAPLKAARLDYVIQKATEMGAGAIQPVITRFTQTTRLSPDKLFANAREAAEQCEVLSIPTILPETSLEKLLRDWPKSHPARRLVLADEGQPSASPIGKLQALKGNPIGVLIGPEGGFAQSEREMLLSLPYVVPISLGPRILRADTAAVAALALVQATIGDWR